MWEWLENTPVAIWVGESLWAYPFWLSLHAVGLAIVVGIFAMRDLRLVGLFQGLSPAAFLALSRFAWTGFVINAISGVFLFTSQASTFVHSTPFLLKIGFIAAGMFLAVVIQGRLRDGRTDGATMKIIALASLAVWLGAIIAGRLIAYL